MSDKLNTHDALDYTFINEAIESTIDIKNLKMVIVSDLHRGAGNGADDFKRCKQIYSEALDYYFSKQYHLALLGDIEELWETDLKSIIRTHKDILLKEKQFIDKKLYTRFYGNHDFALTQPSQIAKLKPYLAGADILRAMTINLKDGDTFLGKLFLTHGDQGQYYSKIMRFAIRYIWRWIQNLTKISTYLPSRNVDKAKAHGEEMYKWVQNKNKKLLLIAGHTHHCTVLPKSDKNIQYLNSGCCAFADGSITTIELTTKEINLVKWSMHKNNPTRHIEWSIPLAKVF